MSISSEQLQNIAASTGFRADILEKVLSLINLLEAFRNHPLLRDKFALKGGTALNVFYLPVPRLSVDIDLNYIGASDKDIMLAEKPGIENAIQAVGSREGFSVTRAPDEHAGGKYRLRFVSAITGSANLEIDINYMYRIPIWPVKSISSQMIGTYQAKEIPVIDIHELAAGKLAALFSRHQARDLFDCHMLLTSGDLELAKLRLAFIVYGAMNRKDWRTVSIDFVDFDESEIERQLLPTLNRNQVDQSLQALPLGEKLTSECKDALSAIFPFTNAEVEFLNLILDHGEIRPEFLTDDPDLQNKIKNQPLLQWKALNVKQYRTNQ